MRKRQANTPPLKQSINPCCGTLIKNIVHFSWRLRHILGTQEQHTVSKRNRGRPTSLFLVKQVRHNQIIRKWCTNRWQINKLKSFVFGRASGQQLTQIFLSSNKKNTQLVDACKQTEETNQVVERADVNSQYWQCQPISLMVWTIASLNIGYLIQSKQLRQLVLF